jgi:hypothetical protein
MSQFTLTPAEDALVIAALHNKAMYYAAMFGAADPELAALIDKVEGQLAATEDAVVTTEDAVEETHEVVEESPAVDTTTD